MSGRAARRRIGLTLAAFGVVFAVLAARATHLALFEGERLQRRATSQHTRTMALEPRRGRIVDRSGKALGLTRESVDVFVHPQQVVADDRDLARLAEELDLPVDVVISKARSDASFVWLRRQLPPARWARIVDLQIKGVGRNQTRTRVYPQGALAGQVVGFTDVDGLGVEGVERRFEEQLRGEVATVVVDRDANRRDSLASIEGAAPLTRVGAQVELTIDADIQHLAETELEAAVQRFAAKAGTAIVLDPRSGEVLAMANVPRFNPNDYRSSVAEQRRNRAVTDLYEPGSTFKAILAAAALSHGAVAPDEVIDCEGGALRIGRRTIHDHHRYHLLTFADVIANSSNIGCAKVGQRLGADRLHAAISDFGFGKRTGIELPVEAPGMVRSRGSWAPIDVATASFGQGVAVTPLQLVAAISGIANRGEMMRPFIVRRVVDSSGRVIEERSPSLARRVVAPGVASTVAEMLVRVVENGTGGRARVPGFAVAGKTGTSQKIDPSRRGYHPKDRIASFVGYLPAHDPALAILVVVDTPTRESNYGGVVAAPVFQRIAEYALGKVGVFPNADPVRERPAPPLEAEWIPAAYSPMDSGLGDSVSRVEGTPSFLGMAMRPALLRAQQLGWRVQVEGSGYVVAQSPAPGAAEPGPDGQMTLIFSMER